jgi:RNA polymerase sigma-70 factor (ECF subfamily)
VTDPATWPKHPEVPASQALVTTAAEAPADFRRVFETEFGWVSRTLRYLGVSRPDLEDVAHEVFLQVYRRFADYDATRPLRPWLFAFAYNVARDFRARSRNAHSTTEDADALVHPGLDADELLIRAEALALALRAMDVLDADERAVFVAHELDEFAAPEIAGSLGVPLNTVYSRLRRARSKFEAAAKPGDTLYFVESPWMWSPAPSLPYGTDRISRCPVTGCDAPEVRLETDELHGPLVTDGEYVLFRGACNPVQGAPPDDDPRCSYIGVLQ